MWWRDVMSLRSCDVVWCGVMWCGVMSCDVVWCDALSCLVMWCVMWHGVMWCNVLCWTVMWCDVTWSDVKWCNGMGLYVVVMLCGCLWRHVMRCDVVVWCGELGDGVLWTMESRWQQNPARSIPMLGETMGVQSSKNTESSCHSTIGLRTTSSTAQGGGGSFKIGKL